jgi:hypothetical protein
LGLWCQKLWTPCMRNSSLLMWPRPTFYQRLRITLASLSRLCQSLNWTRSKSDSVKVLLSNLDWICFSSISLDLNRLSWKVPRQVSPIDGIMSDPSISFPRLRVFITTSW